MGKIKRIRVHKHLYIFHDQVESLNELKEKSGIEVAKIIRAILDHFLVMDHKKQLKIISDSVTKESLN